MRDRCGGDAWAVGGLYVYSLNTLLFLGEYREASRRAPRLVAEAIDRGDLYSATLIRTMAMPSVWLVAGKPAEAWRESTDAIHEWSQDGFHVQHGYDACTRAQVRLYEGRSAEAFAVMDEAIARMRRAFLLRSQHMRIFTFSLRGRSAVAAAIDARATGMGAGFLRSAAADARRLRREGAAYPEGCAEVIEAGIAIAEGKDEAAVAALARAEASFGAVDMEGFAAPARLLRGRLIGGSEGAALAGEGDASLAAQGVVDCPRFAAVFAPGVAASP
jgi:hypothetical protein